MNRRRCWTKAQRRLAKKHGSLEEFTLAVRSCMEITGEEERAAIQKYQAEWDAAGRQHK
jgi:hypothetical protein